MSRASDRAYAEIRGLILSGEIAPGAQLKEEQLAELCGVSRTPVRDALRRLEADLYIVRSGSQRAFVADWSREEVDEMFALFEALRRDGMTILLVEQNVGMALAIADRAYILDGGTVVHAAGAAAMLADEAVVERYCSV